MQYSNSDAKSHYFKLDSRMSHRSLQLKWTLSQSLTVPATKCRWQNNLALNAIGAVGVDRQGHPSFRCAKPIQLQQDTVKERVRGGAGTCW